jgi:hypothetical protein
MEIFMNHSDPQTEGPTPPRLPGDNTPRAIKMNLRPPLFGRIVAVFFVVILLIAWLWTSYSGGILLRCALTEHSIDAVGDLLDLSPCCVKVIQDFSFQPRHWIFLRIPKQGIWPSFGDIWHTIRAANPPLTLAFVTSYDSCPITVPLAVPLC